MSRWFEPNPDSANEPRPSAIAHQRDRQRDRMHLADRQQRRGGPEEADRLHELAHERQAAAALQKAVGELRADVRHREHHEPRQQARVARTLQIQSMHVGEVTRQPGEDHVEAPVRAEVVEDQNPNRSRAQDAPPGHHRLGGLAAVCARMYATSLAWIPAASSGRSLEVSRQNAYQITPSRAEA